MLFSHLPKQSGIGFAESSVIDLRIRSEIDTYSFPGFPFFDIIFQIFRQTAAQCQTGWIKGRIQFL